MQSQHGNIPICVGRLNNIVIWVISRRQINWFSHLKLCSVCIDFYVVTRLHETTYLALYCISRPVLCQSVCRCVRALECEKIGESIYVLALWSIVPLSSFVYLCVWFFCLAQQRQSGLVMKHNFVYFRSQDISQANQTSNVTRCTEHLDAFTIITTAFAALFIYQLLRAQRVR